MQNNELIKSASSILRILSCDSKNAVVIDCIKQTMPVQMSASALVTAQPLSEEDLRATLGIHVREESDLSPAERKTMRERYTLIAPVLPFASEPEMRSMMISDI